MCSLNLLRNIVTNHPVVRHDFLRAFRDGMLTKEQVTYWATQQYFFSISLPSCFAALYARTPYYFWKEKQALLELLLIEAWGSAAEACHSKLFIEFTQSLGIDVNKLTMADERPYTREYLKKRFEICANQSRPIAQGIASIALGNEVLNLSIFGAYQKGINKIIGLEHCPSGYFDAHVRDEESDFQVFDGIFRTLADRNNIALNEAKGGLLEILNARVIFFDALFQEISLMTK